MNFVDTVKSRHSCRSFTNRYVERDKLLEISNLAQLSPSAFNSQRWTIIVVDNPKLTKVIGNGMVRENIGLNRFAPDIPAFFVLVKHPVRKINDKTLSILGDNLDVDWDIDIGILSANCKCKLDTPW